MCKYYSHLGRWRTDFNPLNAKLNPICHFQALLGARHILHVSRLRVNLPPFDIQGQISPCARPSARWEMKPHRTTNVVVTYRWLVGPSPNLSLGYSKQTYKASSRTKLDWRNICPTVTVPTTTLTRTKLRSPYSEGGVLPLLSLKKVTQYYILFANFFVSLLWQTQFDLHDFARGAGLLCNLALRQGDKIRTFCEARFINK